MADALNTSATDEQDRMTARERIIARYGWPLPPMAGAEGDGGDDAGRGAGDGRGTATDPGRAGDAGRATTAGDDVDEQLLAGARNPDAVRNALAGERAKAAEATRRASDLEARATELAARVRGYEDRDRTVSERAAEELEQARRDAATASAKALRYEIAAEAGVPLRHAGRLQGTTREELLADARDLARSFGEQEPPRPPPRFDGGTRTPAKSGGFDDVIRGAARRG